MRNLFGTYRRKEDLKAIADAKPKGIHHTVKYTSSYNETWEHIWRETKKIGLSQSADRCFIREERFSYDVKSQTRPDAADFIKQTNPCKTVKREKLLLTPVAHDQRGEDSNVQHSLNTEAPEINASKMDLGPKRQKEVSLPLTESQGAEILSVAIKLLSREPVPASLSNAQRSKKEDRKAHPFSGINLPISSEQSSKEAGKSKKEVLQPSLDHAKNPVYEKDKQHQKQDIELTCIV
jgi:hypothetical protein